MITAIAPGKIILAGEHAVVYGRPAIAAPVWEVQAKATMSAAPPGSGCIIQARDLSKEIRLAQASDDEALALVTRLALARFGLPANPDCRIELTSEIPIASGLGSGAALSAALVRALALFAGQTPDPALVSELVYESEKLYHGMPSGIDNTVVAYGMPVWYIKGRPPERFTPGMRLTIAIGDSGIASPTRRTVGEVRRRWQEAPECYERWFDEIAAVVHAVRYVIEYGEPAALGALFDQNQHLLAQIGVSTPALEQLIVAAREAGAYGAKLSGGGGGGNMIALVDDETATPVKAALLHAGARRVLITRFGPTDAGNQLMTGSSMA
jgi:mevalonate kinase